MQSVSLSEWVSLAVGLIGLVSAYLQSKNKLPKEAVTWLNKLGSPAVVNAIEYAEGYSDKSSDEKRAIASSWLADTSKRLGVSVPTSIANLLVEHVYQTWKKKL